MALSPTALRTRLPLPLFTKTIQQIHANNMKKVLLMLGLVWAISACETSNLAPEQKPTAPQKPDTARTAQLRQAYKPVPHWLDNGVIIFYTKEINALMLDKVYPNFPTGQKVKRIAIKVQRVMVVYNRNGGVVRSYYEPNEQNKTYSLGDLTLNWPPFLAAPTEATPLMDNVLFALLPVKFNNFSDGGFEQLQYRTRYIFYNKDNKELGQRTGDDLVVIPGKYRAAEVKK